MNRAHTSLPQLTQGFTLTEMAVVLVIVALLVGGMILPMSAQQDIRSNAETQRLLNDVSAALYGYAATHYANDGRPYLPCPDTDGNGTENRNGNVCVQQEGDLPWADLGLGREDAWGNVLRYRVTDVFSSKATGFTLASPGDMRVCSTSVCATVIATTVPVLILSLGKNGLATPTDADELKNKTIDAVDKDFVQRIQVAASFDDVTAWLPQGILINRMISAGRLP